MICKKTFECSTENVDEVVLELAEEIKAGWKIESVEMLERTMRVNIRPEPCVRLRLIRRDEK